MPDIVLQPQGPPGAPGTRVLELKSFPLTPSFGNDGELNGAPGAPGVGTQGQNAWSPLYAITADGARRVLTTAEEREDWDAAHSINRGDPLLRSIAKHLGKGQREVDEILREAADL
jgi:hypothetical protein